MVINKTGSDVEKSGKDNNMNKRKLPQFQSLKLNS